MARIKSVSRGGDGEFASSLFSEAQAAVRGFVVGGTADAAAATAFGVSGAAVAAAVAEFDSSGWPQLVLVDEDVLYGARAAYDVGSDTIYLSRQFVAASYSTPSAITGVLLEELGHAIDVRVNASDSPGDEGAIFANLVLGKTLSATDLSALRAENDQGTISLGDRVVEVEFASNVVGSIAIDGSLADWTAADQIDKTLSPSGYDIYAKATGGSYVFALKAPTAIGAGTTTWLNTDQNTATGYKIWGFAGGAEYNINFDATGTPRLYTGADGQTLVSGAVVSFGYSADKTVVEFSVAASAIGAPTAINTLWDINNNTFLPTDYSATQYAVVSAPAPSPVVGSITLDGNLADWTIADQIDKTLSPSGYDIYAKTSGGSYVFALKAPTAIGAGTTAWLNTDQNAATGYKIWGTAGGAEYNINFDAAGTPRLYTGADGQTLVNVPVTFGYSADRTVVEFSVSAAALGSPRAINTLWDINNNTFLPTDYGATQFEVLNTGVPAQVVGSITLDGVLTDWTAADAIDKNLSTSGYDIYAKTSGDSFVFAIKAPVAIGAGTTAWLNTDQNAATGFKIFGANGGAEYNINFDANGVPRLYTGDAGQTLVSNAMVKYAYSADRTAVEFSIEKSAIGSPVALNTLWDVNNNTFLPTSFATAQYEVLDTSALPVRTDFSRKIGIVYSETTANAYFSKTAYSQLFMAAQNQAAMAGVSFDILTESDLTNLAKLANYDALLFPAFANVQSAQAAAIENTLKLAVQQFQIGLIASGNFMTNDQTGAALPGDSYARMKSLLGLQLVTGGFPANVTVNAGDIAHPMMQDYTSNEVINSYTGTGWLAFAPVSTTGTNVLATQTVGGQIYNSVVSTTTGGKNVHFSSEAVMADNNLLWQAIDFAVNGSGITVGLQLSRQQSIVASRVDMDQAMQMFDVNPADGAPGIYDVMLPILQQWKNAYNFVGSYYLDVGNNPTQDQATDWALSGPYYKRLLDMGNELGSHSLTHPSDTNVLTAAQFQSEFQGSRSIIEQQMSQLLGRPFVIDGAAVPGAPESLAASLAALQYYTYLTGGFSSVGAGYPGAFGYLTPEMAGLDKVYLAPNLQSEFSLVEFRGMTAAQAAAEWAAEVAALGKHAEVPVYVWPLHDYGVADWATNPPADSPYTTAMFTDFIARMYNAGAEFVTLDDLAERVSRFEDSAVTWNMAGSTITATVNSPNAGKFALDLDNLGTQQIARVTGWYAYDNDSVFMPRNGGTYTIQVGAAADDVTHIISLPMRGELLSVTGNGTNLNFSVLGEGRMVVDLAALNGREAVVTGATVVSLVGDKLTLDIGGIGLHDVSVTLAAPANQAPVIGSNGGAATAAVSVTENTTSVTTVAATDPNVGQTITYLITGGADAAMFAINAQSGVLTFTSARDFETSQDVGANNVYDVTVAARDSLGATDTQALAVTITNVGGLTLTGTASANTLTGGGEEDTISGVGGDDILSGLGGNDLLNGGAGRDTLTGGAGNDTLIGGASVDQLNGGDGNDVLTGGASADTLTGGLGVDVFDFNLINEGRDTITDFARGFGGDKLDIKDVLVGYGSGSNINNFVRLSGTTTTTVSVNADGVGTDFVALTTLQNVSMSSSLLNDLLTQGNLVVA